MWIAIVFVIFVNGQAVQDYAAVPTEKECQKLNADLEKTLAKEKQVAGYYTECVNVDDLKKPGVKA